MPHLKSGKQTLKDETLKQTNRQILPHFVAGISYFGNG